MRVTGFRPTTEGHVLVEYRDGSEEGWYRVSLHNAEQMLAQLQGAIARTTDEPVDPAPFEAVGLILVDTGIRPGRCECGQLLGH